MSRNSIRTLRWPLAAAVVALAAALPTGLPVGAATGGKAVELTLLYLGGVQGKIDQCGCKVKQLGGLARRAALIERARKDHPHVVLLDAGGLFGQRSTLEREQTDFLCKETAALGYKVFGVAANDLNYGLEYLRQAEQTHGFVWVNANLRAEAGGPLIFPPYTVVDAGGIRVGITSVIGSTTRIVTMAATPDVFVVDAPRDALARVLPELRGKCDLLVLYAQMTSTETRELLLGLGDAAGIDVCIEGLDVRQYRRLNKIGDTVLLAASNQGKYLGQLNLTVSKGARDIQYGEVTLYELDEKSAEITAVRDRVADFLAAAAAKAAAPVQNTHPRTEGRPGEKFLGAAACSRCHSDDYKSYSTTAHSRAWQTLVEKGQESNPECVGCHVVGFNHVNGFDRATSDHGRNALFNVQCEACHGTGTEHARDGRWAATAKASCTTCHTPENSPDFDYASYWARVAH